MSKSQQPRTRPIAAVTFSPAVREGLLALARQHGMNFSRTLEAVLLRQLDLPAT